MANTLGIFDPIFYATEALIYLKKRLGLASRVYRAYDPTPTQKGSTIQVAAPGTFTAGSMPGAASNITPGTVSIVMNQWQGVVFALSDQELAYTKEKIITDHIGPAAYAVADAIDQTVAALYKDIPFFVAASGPPSTETDIISVRKLMLTNKVPLEDGLMHFMVGPAVEADWLNRQIFSFANQSSDGGDTQRRGVLGQKFGFEIFANQNTPTHVDAALTITGAATLNTATAVGDSTISIKAATTLTGTLSKGDIVVITDSVTGLTDSYACTADTVAAANIITFPCSPAVQTAHLAASTWASTQPNGKVMNLAFHRNAFALAMGNLSTLGDGKGASIATVPDPVTNLALRSTVWYDGNNAQLKVRIDALWGVKTLDARLGCRLHY